MHMHDNRLVRTTIEMKDEHRAALLEIAARRRLKGFSTLVEAAVESYLEADGARMELRSKALALKGSLSRVEGDRLREQTVTLRKSWR